MRVEGKSGFQPFKLYGCSYLMMMAIEDVNLMLISRTIFQSMSSLNVRDRNFVHTQKRNHSDPIRWKRSGRWWNENTFFCHRMFNDPKRERLTIIFFFLCRYASLFFNLPESGRRLIIVLPKHFIFSESDDENQNHNIHVQLPLFRSSFIRSFHNEIRICSYLLFCVVSWVGVSFKTKWRLKWFAKLSNINSFLNQ